MAGDGKKVISIYKRAHPSKLVINPPPPVHLAGTQGGIMGLGWEKWGAGSLETMFCMLENLYRGSWWSCSKNVRFPAMGSHRQFWKRGKIPPS